MEAIDTSLNFDSADGQTKVINRTIGSMPRCLAHEKPKQWDSMLPKVEFTASLTELQDCLPSLLCIKGIKPCY